MEAEMMESSCYGNRDKMVRLTLKHFEFPFNMDPSSHIQHCCTNRLQAFDCLGEVSHEGERADSLSKARDFTKAQDKAVLIGQGLQRTSLLHVVLKQLHLVIRWDEALQQLQEVQAQGLLIITEGERQRRKPQSQDRVCLGFFCIFLHQEGFFFLFYQSAGDL